MIFLSPSKQIFEKYLKLGKVTFFYTVINSQYMNHHTIWPYINPTTEIIVKNYCKRLSCPVRDMKVHGRADVHFNCLLTSVIVAGGWSASFSGRFIPRERVPGTHWIKGWVSVLVWRFWVTEHFFALQGIEFRLRSPSGRRPVTVPTDISRISHYKFNISHYHHQRNHIRNVGWYAKDS
jgi:hypothetical protein